MLVKQLINYSMHHAFYTYIKQMFQDTSLSSFKYD